MIELSKKIARFLLQSVNNGEESSTLKERYKQFRISLLFAITIIALIPSTILAILGYFQYLNLSQQQTATHIRWHLHHVKNTLEENFIYLQTSLASLTGQLSTTHITETDTLDLLFKSMHMNVESLIDLELLDSNGKVILQSSRTMPIRLSETNTPWFRRALSDGTAVSFMKYDVHNSPSFIIAIKHIMEPPQTDLLLKATFNGILLEKLAAESNAKAMEDVFIINKKGILQSPSIYFGTRQNRFPISMPTDQTYFTTTDKGWGMGDIFYATAPLAGTPWILVLVKDGPIHKKEWLTFQLTLLLIFIACAAGSFFVIHQLVNLLTIRIRESDTKRMALLNEVGHTNRLATIGKLAAGVAHEINNPLAVIDQKAGLIEDLLEFSEDFNHKEKIHTSIGGIHNSVDRCKVITHRLLGFARKMDSVEEPVDINFIVSEVMGFLEKEALYSHIIFDMHITDDLPEIWSDRGQLQQIFLNIISNSIDAIGQSGVIRITTSLTEKEKILVEINDNGPGIKPNVMEHIFDPFFTTKETGKGTGLGLSITYGLVKKLGGDIKVFSKAGEGVTFYIYLPTTSSQERTISHG